MIKKYGFTFIEIIIGIAILMVIMLAVYNVLSIGLKVWHRGQAERSMEDVRLAFLKIEKDLKSTFFFSRIPFKGGKKKLTFPLSLRKGDAQKLYSISYKIEKDNVSGMSDIVRIEESFSDDAGKDPEEVNSKKIAGSLESAGFEYAYRAEENDKVYEWASFWDGEKQAKIPSGVRVSVKLKGKEEFYNKVIFLPHGKLGVK